VYSARIYSEFTARQAFFIGFCGIRSFRLLPSGCRHNTRTRRAAFAAAPERSMIQFLLGVLMSGASSTVFWMLRPAHGEPHRLIKKPFFDVSIPIAITMGLVIGLAMIIAGIASLNPF